MKRLHVLLGSSDRASINRIEALVHDLCFERVLVECKRTAKLDDFQKLSRCRWMDLVIFSPDNLLGGGKLGTRQIMEQTLRSVRQVRSERFLPFIAFGVSEENATEVLESGVEVILGPVWEREQLRAEMARVLNVPARVEERVPAKWDFLRLLRTFSLQNPKRSSAST